MTDTLNQAIQPKVVGPLFILSGSTFCGRKKFNLWLVPLLICFEGKAPRSGVRRADAPRGASTF